MPLAGEDLCCSNFQPNIFDPSRCQSCLRLRHLHAKVPPQDDPDDLSVVSSYCDVTRDELCFGESSLCILSPDCELYICDEDDSADSTQDPVDYPKLSDSFSQEDDESAFQDRVSYPTMTRLDPASHRTNPQGWMEEARSRDGFSRQTGAKGQKDQDAGYLSLGRTGGIRCHTERKPPAPYRHLEVGRPLPSHQSPESKATIPFRNPDLGIPSQRRTLETYDHDPPLANSPPSRFSESTYGQSFDVGQRSLSPTPFKQAESLESPQRRHGDSSYSRMQLSSYSSTGHQPGNSSFPQRRGSTFSRSSSPPRSSSPFRQAEQSSLSSRRNFDFRQGSSQGFQTPSPNSYRVLESGSISKNFKSIANSIGSYSQSDSFSNLKNSLRKTDVNVSNGLRSNSRDSSPTKKGYDTPSQSLLRKTDTKITPNSYGCDSRSTSSSRKINDTSSQSLLRKTDTKSSTNSYSNNSRGSSPSRKGFDTSSQSLLRKTDTKSSTNSYSNNSRGSSPSRKGFDTPSQSHLRKTDARISANGYIRDNHDSSSSRRDCNTPSQTMLCKSETRSTSFIRGHDSHTSSPSRKGSEDLNKSFLHRKESKTLSDNCKLNSRSSSPSRQGNNTSSYSILCKTETKSAAGIHDRDSRSPSTSRRSQDSPRLSFQVKTRASNMSNTFDRDSCSSSPSWKVYDINQSPQQKATNANHKSGSVSSEFKKNTSQASRSPSSWCSSTTTLHSPPVSRSSSPSRRQGQEQHIATHSLKSNSITSETNSRGSSRSNSRQRLEPHSSSPEYRPSFHRNRSLSPQSRWQTSSQSSLESESSHLSGGSTYVGLNREEYALMADLPKVKSIYEREAPSQFGTTKSRGLGKEALYKPASHTQTKEVYKEWDGLGERGKGNGRECDPAQRRRESREARHLVKTHSSGCLHTQTSSNPPEGEINAWKIQLKGSSGHTQETPQDTTTGNCHSGYPPDDTRETPSEKASIP